MSGQHTYLYKAHFSLSRLKQRQQRNRTAEGIISMCIVYSMHWEDFVCRLCLRLNGVFDVWSVRPLALVHDWKLSLVSCTRQEKHMRNIYFFSRLYRCFLLPLPAFFYFFSSLQKTATKENNRIDNCVFQYIVNCEYSAEQGEWTRIQFGFVEEFRWLWKRMLCATLQ